MNRPQEVERSSWVADLLASLFSEYGKANFACDEYDEGAVELLIQEWAPYCSLRSEWIN